jgi:hypothetical protein
MANSAAGKGDVGAASADSVVVRVQFNDEWIVRFHVGSLPKNCDILPLVAMFLFPRTSRVQWL